MLQKYSSESVSDRKTWGCALIHDTPGSLLLAELYRGLNLQNWRNWSDTGMWLNIGMQQYWWLVSKFYRPVNWTTRDGMDEMDEFLVLSQSNKKIIYWDWSFRQIPSLKIVTRSTIWLHRHLVVYSGTFTNWRSKIRDVLLWTS